MVHGKVEVWQGVAAFVGITLGVIPLVQWLLTDATGSLWQLLPGGGSGTPALVAAVVVLIGAIGAVALLERGKRP